MSLSSVFLSLSLLLSFSTMVFSDEDCVYTMYVRTGSVIKGGTDSTISATLYDTYGYGVEVPDLERWGGLMEPGHNYFERGNLDIFSGRAPCLSSPGSTRPVHRRSFEVEQWLALDTSPYSLVAFRDYCDYLNVKKSAGSSSV
ncbi:hypothetical protein OIU76_024945 [Salix suchowensis]|nr:hypothetical protein OIU76_024945 [Salix suchowensis]